MGPYIALHSPLLLGLSGRIKGKPSTQGPAHSSHCRSSDELNCGLEVCLGERVALHLFSCTNPSRWQGCGSRAGPLRSVFFSQIGLQYRHLCAADAFMHACCLLFNLDILGPPPLSADVLEPSSCRHPSRPNRICTQGLLVITDQPGQAMLSTAFLLHKWILRPPTGRIPSQRSS